MRVLLHTRTAQELDWARHTIELRQLPRDGEYISTNREGREAEWHRVRLVIHVADADEPRAELYCLSVTDNERRLLMFGQDVSAPAVSPDERNSEPFLLTLKQAETAAGTSGKTLRRLIQAGRLHAVDYGTKGGRHEWRISREALASVKPAAQDENADTPARARRRRISTPGSVQSFLPLIAGGKGMGGP
jgi:hypothetical protein